MNYSLSKILFSKMLLNRNGDNQERPTIAEQNIPKTPNIGIKHGFSCINIRQVPLEVLKTEDEGHGFQHLPRDLANVNALKKHVRSILLHKN